MRFFSYLKQFNFKVISIFLILLTSIFVLTGCGAKQKEIVIGVSWCQKSEAKYYEDLVTSLDNLKINYVILDQIKSESISYVGENVTKDCLSKEGFLLTEYANRIKNDSFEKSNVANVIKKVDAVIFPGGEDVSPTLYENPKPWHGIEEEIDYNATRDINDYILMNYCIQNDIPTMGICRGLQILGICSGATVIQDIPMWFKNKGITYDNSHRSLKDKDGNQDYAAHDVTIKDKNSIIYNIIGDNVLKNVPSWHHQSLESVSETSLKVTGISNTCGYEMIEAVEYVGKKNIIGYQFHPETAIAKNIRKEVNASNYMSLEIAKEFFENFAKKVSNI